MGPSLANMAANALEIGILQTAAWWFWQPEQALNRPKGVFSVRIHLLDRGEYMLTQKFLVDISINIFPVKNQSVA
jgi:hypothetical protein